MNRSSLWIILVLLLLAACFAAPQTQSLPTGAELGELDRALEREQADTYAGLWLKDEPGFGVVIAFTKNGNRTLRPYIKSKPWANLVEAREVEFSLVELAAARERVGQAAASLGLGSSSGTDVMRNRVVFEVGNPELFKDELRRINVMIPEMVEVVAYDPDNLSDTLRSGVETYSGPEGQTIYFPKQAPTNVFLEARMGGTLILDENGCLRVDGGNGEDLLMLWHHNFTLRVSGEKVEVLNGQGQVVARVGESMTGGGGEVPFTTIPGLPIEDCPSQKYWQLGDIKLLP